MAQRGGGSSNRVGKKRDRSRVLAEAAEFLAACEQKGKRKNRTASVFWKNPSTGLRTTHSKYRPRKGHRASSVIPEARELYLKFVTIYYYIRWANLDGLYRLFNIKAVEPTFQDADHSADEYPAEETDHASQGSLYTL